MPAYVFLISSHLKFSGLYKTKHKSELFENNMCFQLIKVTFKNEYKKTEEAVLLCLKSYIDEFIFKFKILL